MPSTARETRSRTPQVERTRAMRGRLLDATMQSIAEEGWAHTSTLKICERAGVSRGAQTHHFPTKESLLIAAVEEIVARYQRQIEVALAKDQDERPALRELFEFLWDTCFETPFVDCWIEAMVAARTDSYLGDVVAGTDDRSIKAIRSLGEACDSRASSADVTELTIYLLRGIKVTEGSNPKTSERKRLFELWTSLIAD